MPESGNFAFCRKSTPTDNSTAPLLVYIVAALSLILSILVIDLHRDELRAVGLVGGAERINPVFMSP